MVFFSLPAAMLVFARRLAGDPRWKTWILPTVIATGFAFACFIASNISALHSGPAGLFQRLCITTYLMWLAAFAYRAGMLASSAANPLQHACGYERARKRGSRLMLSDDRA